MAALRHKGVKHVLMIAFDEFFACFACSFGYPYRAVLERRRIDICWIYMMVLLPICLPKNACRNQEISH